MESSTSGMPDAYLWKSLVHAHATSFQPGRGALLSGYNMHEQFQDLWKHAFHKVKPSFGMSIKCTRLSKCNVAPALSISCHAATVLL